MADSDRTRAVVVAATALAQVLVGSLSQGLVDADSTNAAISDDNRSPVTPAGYAFAIWGLIYAASLVLAAYHQREETVAALLEAGADPDRVNDNGQTALMSAVFRGNETIVRTLLAAGASQTAGAHSALRLGGRQLAGEVGVGGVGQRLLEGRCRRDRSEGVRDPDGAVEE